MKPSLGERLKWSSELSDVGTSAASKAVMARTLAYFFALASTFAFLSVLLPHPDNMFVPGILAPAFMGYIVAAGYIAGFERLPQWSFHLPLVGAIALIAVGGVSAGATLLVPCAVMYFWIAIIAFALFERRYAAIYVGMIAAAFATVLTLTTSPDRSISQWIMLMGAIIVAGLVIGLLRTRLESVVAMLGNAARTDPLTGLANRRGFQAKFDADFARAVGHGRPLGLICVDLDRFKLINDQFGHDVGDGALQHFGDVIRASIRHTVTAGRLGGEEFVVIVPDGDVGATLAVAEDIREEVWRAFADDPFRVTVSCGVASMPLHAHTQKELFQLADKALYAAKELGRNRSVVYSATVEEAVTDFTPRWRSSDLLSQPLDAA